MFVTIFGYPPFYDEDGQDEVIFQKIEQGFCPEVKKGFGAFFPKEIPISSKAKDLMKNCLEMDVAKRISANEALKHPWFAGASDKPLVDNVLKNLQTFIGKQKFQVAVLEMMTSLLTDSDLEKLGEAFRAIDKNKDGLITASELKEAIGGGFGEMAEQFEKLIETGDFDGDGKLSYRELQMTCVHDKN
eukprot:TRINITY_DN663_c0_g2_i2.p1 TRINITY_DN663_c0_g2~~TRINITY_DN663_c0_g2_i2.p1  ORF type:complete len:188 (+),score=37.77 TRINITY_DN663_c0_g2_i2:2-565(+)